MSICAHCKTLKNAVLLSIAYSSSIVPTTGMLAAIPHGFSPWEQPSWILPYLEAAILSAWVAIVQNAFHFKQQI